VLGFPSNQFLQELGSSEAIKEFCSTTYGVTFPMFEKIRVNGRSQHPLYAELTRTPDANGKAGKVRWNFEKFVVTPAGEVHRFRPTVEPDAPRDPRSDRSQPAHRQLTTDRRDAAHLLRNDQLPGRLPGELH
jgi:glutathione peroxidase-family protein